MRRGGCGGQRRAALQIAAGVALAWVWSPARAHAADEAALVIDNLRRARSFKVRLQAATVLARMRDGRVIAELGRAAIVDRNPAVRGYVLELLGSAPESLAQVREARAAVRRALGDRRSEVRRHASQALAALERRQRTLEAAAPPPALASGPAVAPPGPLVIAVGGVSDRTGRARPALRAHLRRAIVAGLRSIRRPPVTALESLGIGPPPSYVIDGTLARLEHGEGRIDLEITCAVQLVISRPPRGIVMVASGEATVIKPRYQVRGGGREAMESEAVEHAVKGANDNLARFLATAR